MHRNPAPLRERNLSGCSFAFLPSRERVERVDVHDRVNISAHGIAQKLWRDFVRYLKSDFTIHVGGRDHIPVAFQIVPSLIERGKIVFGIACHRPRDIDGWH